MINNFCMLIKGESLGCWAHSLAPSSISACLWQVFFKNLHFLFSALPHSPQPPTYTSHSRLSPEAEAGQEWVKAAHLSGPEGDGLGICHGPSCCCLPANSLWMGPKPPLFPSQLPGLSAWSPRQMRPRFRLAGAPAMGTATQISTVCVCFCLCVGSGGGVVEQKASSWAAPCPRKQGHVTPTSLPG